VELKLERCTICDWRLEDAPSLTKHANNRRVWLGLRGLFPHPYAIENAHEFLRQATAEKPTTKFCIDLEGAAAAASVFVLGKTSTDMSANSVIGSVKSSGAVAS
jgi:hypothetical protein